MIAFPAGTKVWIAGGVTDMRCGMNSLALKIQDAYSDEAGHAFQLDAGHLFRFHSGRHSDLKPATFWV